MAFSERQLIYSRYLLNKIGFSDNKHISMYLEKLESIYGRYYKEWRQETTKKGYVRDYWILRYSNFECIEELLKEIEIKNNLNGIQSLNTKFESKVSATDLSSFDFCPASYSIAKSFQVEHPTREDKRLIGIKLHETLRLINKQLPLNFKESDLIDYAVLANEKIKKIKDCELIFSGHSDEKLFFVNENKNYIGKPDYIFKDPNGKYFVVEEKFKYLNNYINPEDCEYENIVNSREQVKNTFFSNHIIQLQSYVDYIQNYNIDYGVLIYWFFDFRNEIPNIHYLSMKIVKKNEFQTSLENTFSNLNSFVSEKSLNFHKEINPNKCAACTVNKYCAHKTNNIKELNLPYDKNDLKLKYIEFPESLKKNKDK